MRLDANERMPCFHCGKRESRAMWSGWQEHLYVCEFCALDILPRLLADALSVSADNPIDAFSRALEQAKGRFWYAVASRLASEGRKPKGRGMNA